MQGWFPAKWFSIHSLYMALKSGVFPMGKKIVSQLLAFPSPNRRLQSQLAIWLDCWLVSELVD